jgi:hypothetical protein
MRALEYESSPRFSWKPNAIVVLWLDDGLYSVAQLLTAAKVAFYDLSSPEDSWGAVDLSTVSCVFCAPVISLRGLYVRRAPKTVKPALNFRMPLLWLDSNHSHWPPRGGHIVRGNESGRTASPDGGPDYVKMDIGWETDREALETLEFTNLLGPELIQTRLVAWFREGRRMNPYRDEVFGPPPEI